VLDAEILGAELDARVHVALWVIQELDAVNNYHAGIYCDKILYNRTKTKKN
jgi:hypothetical protein